MSSEEKTAKLYQINDTVFEIAKIHLEGDIIPHEWYKKITRENGKPDNVAIAILSHILYWYRPVQMNEGGRPVLYKKFSSDLLQKNYQDFQDYFGFSRKQLLLAFRTLERLGLAQRILRTIFIKGLKMSNVLFIEIFPKAIAAISIPERELKESVPYCPESQEGGLLPSTARPHVFQGKTNTETTSETTLSLISEKKTNKRKKTDCSKKYQKETVSLKSVADLKRRFRLSDQQIDTIQWIEKVRERAKWTFEQVDDGFIVWMVSEFPQEQVQNAVEKTLKKKPHHPGKYLRSIFQDKGKFVVDWRVKNVDLAKQFKITNSWEDLEIGEKSCWFNVSGIEEIFDINVDPEHFPMYLQLKFNLYKKISKDLR